MKKTMLAATIAVLAVMSSAHADAETREESRQYTVLGDLTVICDDPDVGNLGGACFELFGDESAIASIVIEDITGLPTGAAYQFDNNDDIIGFCGSVEDVAIPEGSSTLTVWVDGPVFGVQDCLLEGHTSPGIAVSGEIHVTFSLQVDEPEE